MAFYRDVFGWDTHVAGDTDEFRYTTLGEGENQLAGIMDDSPYPEHDPPHWAIYFRVDDTDAALEKIVELGGSVIQPRRTRRTAASHVRRTRPARSSGSSPASLSRKTGIREERIPARAPASGGAHP